ncbi:hypothetical protein PFISCL1PPCAC_3797 [Pristionchus fissidentatus]|uniref:CHK kinase-like domain-containing protein n=1 Tax=Pristionchus fissidentatus TaxID=1538716 RepID=A0AAV5UYZ5_9BILA|nr:hypothetical protein PFISCL1PPCAC_3797 [Pristionchus fissidentatus]
MAVVLTPERQVIVDILRRQGVSVSDEDAFSFSRIGEGRGFCSLLYRVNVGDRSFAVKITNPQGSITGAEGTAGLHENVHNRECDFYRWAAGYLTDGELTDLEKIARTYGDSKCEGREGLLIMEDFSGRMTSDVDYTKGFSVDVVKSILRSIVGYQSAFFSSKNTFSLSDKSVVNAGLKGMGSHCIDAFPQKEWLSEERRKTLHAISDAIVELQEDYPEPAKSLRRSLVHCDLWPNNMLFEKTPDHPQGTLMAIVDWQCANVGNALLDVASAIGVCLTPEDRRAHEEELVEYYLGEMEKRKHRFTQSFEMDKDTAYSQYRHSLKWAALQLVFTTVFNPTADLPSSETEDGPLSTRLNAILDDIGI